MLLQLSYRLRHVMQDLQAIVLRFFNGAVSECIRAMQPELLKPVHHRIEDDFCCFHVATVEVLVTEVNS